MSFFEAVVLGLVQGLTEFLPISSTGHLRIVPAFAGWDDPGAAFTAIIQLGTMAAVVVYFRSDLIRIGRAWLAHLLRKGDKESQHDARVGWFLLYGTVPISIFGLLFKDQIETGARSLWLIAAALIIFGFVMLGAERAAKQERDLRSVSLRDTILIGCAQAFALIPGVSRSGATISAGLLTGLKREDAARFSFLLSIPAVVLSGLFQLYELLSGSVHGGAGVSATVVATLIAFASGYGAIAFLLRYLATHTTTSFVVYRCGVGLLVLGCAAGGVIH